MKDERTKNLMSAYNKLQACVQDNADEPLMIAATEVLGANGAWLIGLSTQELLAIAGQIQAQLESNHGLL